MFLLFTFNAYIFAVNLFEINTIKNMNMIKKTFGLFTALLFSCVTGNVQAQNSEKEFIQENMEFAEFASVSLLIKARFQALRKQAGKKEALRKGGHWYADY